jgi:signal transduction histidine kinase
MSEHTTKAPYSLKQQRFTKYIFLATCLAVVLLVISLPWRINDRAETTLFISIAQMIAALLASFWCFQTAILARKGPIRLHRRDQYAWFTIGASILLYALWLLLHMWWHQMLPLLQDVSFALLSPLLLLLGIFLLSFRTRFSFQMLLDAIITTLSLFGIAWVLMHIPERTLPFLGEVVAPSPSLTLLYLCPTLAPLFGIAYLLYRDVHSLYKPSSLLLIGGLGIFIISDIISLYTGAMDRLQNSLWIAGCLLTGLSSLYSYREVLLEPEEASSQKEPVQGNGSITQNLLVYIPMLLLFVLTAYRHIRINPQYEAMVLPLLILSIGILIGARFFVASRENEGLLREKSAHQDKMAHLHQIVARLTQHIELKPLREQATRTLITDLGFDAALLLLVEEHRGPYHMPPHLHILAAAHKQPLQSWFFQGENILQRTYRSEHETLLHWNSHTPDIPEPVASWFLAQRIATMTFFPLSYHGQRIGCLGVARQSSTEINEQDRSLLVAYSEQVATLLRHAQLYQETQEREAFAQAMANIATRLNAAVIEPEELSQLICEEGARALRADFTIFYLLQKGQGLQPQAAYSGSDQPIHWPPISLYEPDAQALEALQPTLIVLEEEKQDNVNFIGKKRQQQAQGDEHSTYRIATQSRQGFRDTLIQQGVTTAILTPLIEGGEPFGLLVFARSSYRSSTTTRPLDLPELSQAQDFGEQAGVAYTNAQLYQRLQTAHSRLQELDQMKDQFMVTASHELRTPLTAVQGYIELLAQYDEILPANDRREFLEKARRGCDELAMLLCNVMDASRLDKEMTIGPALFKNVSVQEAIESVVLMIEPQLTKEQRNLHLHVPTHLMVRADPMRLRQVLMNICTNALKYSPPQTPLSIVARVREEEGRQQVMITISDRGKGIKPEDHERVFQRFFRVESDVNSPVRGSGLGLYISRRLIEAMGGKIRIESEGIPGKGTTISILLPMA